MLARAGLAGGRGVLKLATTRQRVILRQAARRTTNPRQYLSLRWVESLSLHYQRGWGVELGLDQRHISRSIASEGKPNNNTIDSHAGLPVIEDEYP